MRAAVCHEYGPPGSLVIAEVDDPEAAPDEVVVDVAFAAVNYPDVLIIANTYQVPAPTPFVPGSEFAGVVREVGAGVTELQVGDRVFGSTFVGAFAERIVVRASALKRVPDGVDLEAAAGFWVAHATAFHSIRSIAEVLPGERVVVLGAAGGVGLAAVEIAVAFGAEVIAAASSDEKLAICRERGAAHTVNYADGDLRDLLRAIHPDGTDVVLDPVGGPLAERALRTLRWKGRFVTIGFASGEIPRIPLNLVLLKGCIIRGFEMRSYAHYEPESAAEGERELVDMLLAGRLRPHISAIHDLDDAVAALEEVAERRARGKVLVRCTAP